MDSFPYWKNIYKTLVSKHNSVTIDCAKDVVNSANSELLQGLLVYNVYTKESYDKWKEKSAMKDHKVFCSFMQYMSKAMNIDCEITYTMFCNFIMFEYYGRIEDVAGAAGTEFFRIQFVQYIWNFVRAERMFHIKTLQYIVKEYKNKKHRLHGVYNSFIEKNGMKKVRAQLREQFTRLIDEAPLSQDLFINDRTTRKNIETMEVLISYIYTMESSPLDEEELFDMLTVFQHHGFAAFNVHTDDDLNCTILEYAAVIVGLQDYWSNKVWQNGFEKLEKIFIEHSSARESNPLILLCWGLLLTNIPPDQRDQSKHSIFVVQNTLTPEAFTQLLLILKKCNVEGSELQRQIRKATFCILEEILSRLENIAQICANDVPAGEILAILMEDLDICDRVCRPGSPINNFMLSTLNLFPYNFSTFCALIKSLLKNPKHTENAVQLLFNLSVYTEENYQVENFFNKTLATYSPLDDIEIPIGASVTTLDLSADQHLMQFEGDFTYTFFLYFECVMNQIKDYVVSDMQQTEEFDRYVDVTIKGLDLIITLMRIDKKIWQYQRHFTLISCTQSILRNVKVGEYRRWELFDKILQFYTVAIRAEGRPLINMLLYTRCLPTAPAGLLSFLYQYQLNVANDCQLLQLVIQECSEGNYVILGTYLQFLSDALEHQMENEKFLIPGVLFILINVFPFHLNWKERGINEKNEITMNMLKLLVDVLQVCSESKDVHLKAIYDMCIDTILNSESLAKSIIAIIRYKNSFLENLMLTELDWNNGHTLNIIRSVRLSLTIVLFLYSHIDYEKLKTTMFWKFFTYTGMNFPSVFRVICEYMNHKFDAALPPLACTLFRRICMDSHLPVLASLELNEYQIHLMFLERLRDPLENDEMRILLLQLIITCVENQNGMTAALFNLHKTEEIDPDDTILAYMGDYLKVIAEKPEYFESPVQVVILKLFHTLWVRNRTLLIDDLIKKKNFWRIILNPLSNVTGTITAETYWRILDILAIETSYVPMSAELEIELRKIFDPKTNILSEIMKILMKGLKDLKANPGIVEILQTWKKFTVYMMKSHMDIVEMNARQILITGTMRGLIEHLENPQDKRVVGHWLDLYLYITKKCDKDDLNSATNFESVISIFKGAEQIYLELPNRTKDTLMTIAINCLDQFSGLFDANSGLAQEFLLVMNSIIEMQYDYWLSIRANNDVRLSDNVVWKLIITFANRLLKNEMHHKWIFYTQLIPKAMNTLGYFLSTHKTIPIAKLSAQFLFNCVCTPMYRDFATLNFTMIYDTVAPPRDLLQFESIHQTHLDPDYYVEFWQTYCFLFHLNAKLLQKMGHLIFKSILEFIYMQRTEIINILKLPQVTVHPIALRLVNSYLDLYTGLMKWKNIWIIFDEASCATYYNLLPNLYYTCLNVALSPRVMKFYISEGPELTSIDSVPLYYMADIMNGILNILSKISYAFYKTSPNLFDQLNKPANTDTLQQKFALTWDFHTPDYTNPQEKIERLTFGAILSLLHYLCKIKHQQLKVQPSKDTMLYLPQFMFETLQKEPLEWEDWRYTSFVYHKIVDDVNQSASDKLNPLQKRLQSSEIYNLSSPWLAAIDSEVLNTTFEIVGTLLASQVHKHLKMPYPVGPSYPVQLLRRELCPELQFFNEFVHKKLTDSQRYQIDGNTAVCIRKSTKNRYETSEYLLMLSSWFIQVCEIAP